jgi:hypothetical protein
MYLGNSVNIYFSKSLNILTLSFYFESNLFENRKNNVDNFTFRII